MTATTLGNWFL